MGVRNGAASLLVGELAANAAAHRHGPPRDFLVHLAVQGDTSGGAAPTLRIEVSDACAEHHPKLINADQDAECGRGMFLVDILASAWGSYPRSPDTGIGKTVWAECPLTPLPKPDVFRGVDQSQWDGGPDRR